MRPILLYSVPHCRRSRGSLASDLHNLDCSTVGLIGASVGALFWGTVSDYIGRRTAFSATIGIFSVFTAFVAASWNVASLAVFRFLLNTGLRI